MPKTKGLVERRKSRRSSHRIFNESNNILEYRLRKERKVNEIINDLNVPLFNVCIENGPFRSLLTDVTQVGSGCFGNVYSARLNNSPKFVIKEAVLKEEEEKRIRLSAAKSYIVRNSYPDEYKILTLVNDALYSEKCPNFLLTYNLAVCDGCRLSQVCYVAFLEQAVSDVSAVFFNDDIAISMLFQLFAALCWLHFTYGIFHSDIKDENIMVLRGETGGSTKYIINGNEYFVKNVGYTFCLNDFGLSQIYNPNFTNQNFLGTRNCRVVNDRLEPIYCKYGLTFSSNKAVPLRSAPLPVKWDNGIISTENRFSTTVDPEPTTVVDLSDTMTFPPFEFCADIQNLMRTIVGGKSAYHIVDHPKMPISRPLEAAISKYCIATFPYSYNSAKYVRSDLMLKALYSELAVYFERQPYVSATWNVV